MQGSNEIGYALLNTALTQFRRVQTQNDEQRKFECIDIRR